MAPVKRGWIGALADRLFGWMNGLPSESGSYTIESLRIPVGGSVEIAADVYRPLGAKPAGTVLVRSPYGIGTLVALSHARIFAARGYQVVFSACRGTSDSDGELGMGAHEFADGHATVAWMRKQPWYTGSFATLGASYLGFAQWALLSDPPEDMKTAIINTGPHDLSFFSWGTGALHSHTIAWADLIARMKRGGLEPILLYVRAQPKRLAPLYRAAPMLDAVDKHFGGTAPEGLRHALTHPDRKDPYWKGSRHDEAIDRANIPILLTTGWYDLVLPTVMDQYSRLLARGCNVALTIGPWTHLGAGGRNTMPETLAWLDEHLADRTAKPCSSPVRVFVTGSREWRELEKWPPAASPQDFFLQPGKKLSANLPPKDATESVFKFDPADPTPSIGVPLVFDGDIGKKDKNTALAARSDVLTFTAEPLERDLEVCGKPSVDLHHSTDHPHGDLLVMLSEVDGKGVSRTVSERYIRLDPTRGPEPLHLELHDCAHKFQKGNRVRLYIAGGAHPRYIRNLGTGENPGTGPTLRPTWHTIHHQALAASKLVLPITTPEN
ncbi:CocE/NonD hydrolase [Thozetella sp. PMI_491]|nr:CocE/NonD hydrolase [Thozetella sp. PMI_491]